MMLILCFKGDILKTRFEVQTNANIELIKLYFRIGKIVSENAKYGNKFIQDFSTSLKLEFTDTTGFSTRNYIVVELMIISEKIRSINYL